MTVESEGRRGRYDTQPGPGDWFVLADGKSNWVGHNSAKNRRFIVLFERLGQLIVFARSGDEYGYDGRGHPKHDGCCGVAECKIDVDGRISHDPVPPVDVFLARDMFSCHEPDEEILDWMWENRPRRWA